MFVWGFLLGFCLAFIVNWFWVRQLRAASSFGQVMGKESSGEKYRDTVIDLEIEVEHLQEQIQRMEEHLSYGGAYGDIKEKTVAPVVSPVIRQGYAPVREFPREEVFIGSSVTSSNKKIQKQGEVLSLWEQGKKISEIAKDTGLGQGEVELILSLRNKLHRPMANKESSFQQERDRLSG